MSQEGEDFLSRWSRRKLATGQGDRAQPAASEREAETTESAKVGDEGSSEPALTPEEIAALPKIEDLTPDSDITVFLRKGVPEMLKNAALRRMWALDPAIRDYVGDARDYAYDWNIPGSVPGGGPLRPTDDVRAMLKELFRDGPAEVEPRASSGSPGIPIPQMRKADLAPDQTGAPDAGHMNDISAPQQDREPPGGGQAVATANDASTARMERLEPSYRPDVAPSVDHPPASAPRPLRRRHGGAKPG
jgi:hypothetical protein